VRIAIVAPTTYSSPPAAYGGEAEVWYVARALGELGHEVHLFAPGGSSVPPGGYLHYIRGSYGEASPAFEYDPWDHYREELLSCDIVHDWSHNGVIMEELWIERSAFPAIHTYNGISFNHPRCVRRNSTVASQAHLGAALAGRSALYGVEGVDYTEGQNGRLHNAKVVHWGTDTDFYCPHSMDPVVVQNEVIEPGYVLYLGRPHPAKGVDLLMTLAGQMPEERFVFAWRAAAEDHFRYESMYLETAKAHPNVRMLKLPVVGHHEEKRRLYRNAKVFCSPARYLEAMGMTGLEALACGTPVILGSNGAGPEIVTHPEMGRCVDAHKKAEGPLQLQMAIAQAGLFDREVCRRQVVERFSMKVIVPQYVSLYEAVIGGEIW
jgi:glycosyltransferase involved in cell wall biosynthesis